MKKYPYALATDGSNDNGLEKMNPLTVRIFDVNAGKVKTSLLDMCMTPSGTALDIFNAIDRCMTLFDVPWSNCVAVGVDNANVNMGNRHSIKTMVQEKNPNVFFNGCQCHVVHNTSAAAASAFTEATGFDVSDILVDLYYWFDHSSKRKNLLVEYSGFCDQEYRQVIKYASTRWLSLERCVTRALQQYESLKSYFLSEKSSQARFKRLQTAFQDPMTEVYLLFYQSALQIFIQLNQFLQRGDPLIGAVSQTLQRFQRLLACKFIPPATVKAAKSHEDLLDSKQWSQGMMLASLG